MSLHHFEDELPRQYRFLKSLIAGGLETLVVAGTCLEYGLDGGRLKEADPLKPNTPYGFAKNVLREQLEYLRCSTPFDLTWARLFYLYGDGQSPHSLWMQLRAAVDRKDPLFDMSGGEQVRDYLPVTEAAGYLVSFAESGKDVGVVNVCSGEPVSVRALVERWIAEHGWSITPNLGQLPYAAYEPMSFWGDATKLRQVLRPA
jgi:dTDP-6-deoxy-L-talose 4-dehydrogenase (NAD+)